MQCWHPCKGTLANSPHKTNKWKRMLEWQMWIQEHHLTSILFRGELGECLLEGHSHSASGYIMRPGPIMISLDLCVLEVEIQFLSYHLLMVNFILPKPKFGFLEPWMEPSNTNIKNGHVSFNHEAWFGFSYLKCNSPETMKQVSCKFHSTMSFTQGPPLLMSSIWIITSQLDCNQGIASRILAISSFGGSGSWSRFKMWSWECYP